MGTYVTQGGNVYDEEDIERWGQEAENGFHGWVFGEPSPGRPGATDRFTCLVARDQRPRKFRWFKRHDYGDGPWWMIAVEVPGRYRPYTEYNYWYTQAMKFSEIPLMALDLISLHLQELELLKDGAPEELAPRPEVSLVFVNPEHPAFGPQIKFRGIDYCQDDDDKDD